MNSLIQDQHLHNFLYKLWEIFHLQQDQHLHNFLYKLWEIFHLQQDQHLHNFLYKLWEIFHLQQDQHLHNFLYKLWEIFHLQQDQHLHNFFAHCHKMSVRPTLATDFETSNKLKVRLSVAGSQLEPLNPNTVVYYVIYYAI